MCSSFCVVGRWLVEPPLPSGWLALRSWLVLGLMALALGMGGWTRPAASKLGPVAELGLHAGPSGHGEPAERNEEPPLTGEAKDSKDAQDELRERTTVELPWLRPCLDLDLAAAVSKHRFAEAHEDGSGSSHHAAPRNRGPPFA